MAIKIFIAAPLFNEMELQRNSVVKQALRTWGYDVFLAQDNAGVSYDLITEQNKQIIRRDLFQKDVQGLKESHILVLLLDGRVPDEGACIEMGMAFAWNKPCLALKTDNRAMDCNGDNNIMIDGCLNLDVTSSLSELKDALEAVVSKISR